MIEELIGFKKEEEKKKMSSKRKIWLVIGVFLILVMGAGFTVSSFMGDTFGDYAGSMNSGYGNNYTETIVKGSGQDKVLVLNLNGAIVSEADSFDSSLSSKKNIVEKLDQAKSDYNVKGILLLVNSPGGEAVASEEVYSKLKELRESGIKVVTYSGGLDASGAYMVSVASDKIIAHPMSMVGSIGVIMEFLNFEKLANDYGVSDKVYKSGEFKDMGNPFRQTTPSEDAIFQELVDDTHGYFVDIVKEGRNMKKEDVEKIANGQIYTGKKAKELGLIDELGNQAKAEEEIKDLIGVDEVTFVTYEEDFMFGNFFESFLTAFSKEGIVKIIREAINPKAEFKGLEFKWSVNN